MRWCHRNRHAGVLQHMLQLAYVVCNSLHLRRLVTLETHWDVLWPMV